MMFQPSICTVLFLHLGATVTTHREARRLRDARPLRGRHDGACGAREEAGTRLNHCGRVRRHDGPCGAGPAGSPGVAARARSAGYRAPSGTRAAAMPSVQLSIEPLLVFLSCFLVPVAITGGDGVQITSAHDSMAALAAEISRRRTATSRDPRGSTVFRPNSRAGRECPPRPIGEPYRTMEAAVARGSALSSPRTACPGSRTAIPAGITSPEQGADFGRAEDRFDRAGDFIGRAGD
jgi:hypothetical protein